MTDMDVALAIGGPIALLLTGIGIGVFVPRRRSCSFCRGPIGCIECARKAELSPSEQRRVRYIRHRQGWRNVFDAWESDLIGQPDPSDQARWTAQGRAAIPSGGRADTA